MPEEQKDKLPPHLMALMNPTPNGTSALLAAWDGLSMESQMQVLMALNKTRHPGYLSQKILRKALDSQNACVRYMAATRMSFVNQDEEEEKALKEKIESDSDPLVKYSLLEGGWDESIHLPQTFFNLPHAARLAIVRGRCGAGKEIAKLITYAVENLLEQGKVSETELNEIVTDYINNPAFQKFYGKDSQRITSISDGFGAALTESDLFALWNLVPKVPEEISHVLLSHLPEFEEVVLNEGFLQDVLDQLTSNQLVTLLYRPDIELRKFRKQIFFKPIASSDDDGDLARHAAISNNFSLTYEEFSNILKKREKKKISILRRLASCSGDLNLVFYLATHDILSKSDDWWEDAESAETQLEREAKWLEGWKKKSEMTQLKLYQLAKDAVPWEEGEEGYLPKGKLEFLAPLSVPGDTWQTFMNYSKEWAKHDREKLWKYLPFVYEIEEEAEQNIRDQEPKSNCDQPLSRKEFYDFHLERNINFGDMITFICGVFAIGFSGSAIWGILFGEQESLSRDVGFAAMFIFGFTYFYAEIRKLREKRERMKKEAEDL